MNALRHILPAILLICASGVDTVQASSLLASENGSFAAYIVVPERASEIERFAADELAKYIVRITGAEISVVKEKHDLDYFGFYVGHTLKGKKYILPKISPYEGANGFRIKSVPEGLVIVGGDDLSTLFGAYAFLEEYQGCGWFMPSELGEVVPQREGIIIPENIDVTQVPDIPIRWIGYGDWSLKNRMNAGVQIHGHTEGVINRWNFHTYQILVPDGTYFDVHPEYYSLTESERIPGRSGQICTSNSEVIRLVSQHLVDELSRNPDIQYISLTANDQHGYCECSRCAAQAIPEFRDDLRGTGSGQFHTFNNEVARRVGKYCPTQIVKGGAYSGYVRYPTDPSIKPADNLAIIFTPHISFCHNHSIADKSCPYVTDFMRDYYDWAKNSKHLHIYDYASLHQWAEMPWPMVHVIKKDIPEYHRTGVEQYYTQAVQGTFEAYALNYYVTAKLVWNVSLNVHDLVKEFCDKMYGAAGPIMEKYFWLLENGWENNPGHVAYDTVPLAVSLMQFFTPDVVAEADRLLKEAEAVDTDENSKKRIRLIRVDFDYLRLVLNYVHTILKPYEGVNPEDKNAMDTAARQAFSIGEVMASTIYAFLDENYPGTLQNYWTRGGVERMLGAHTSNPSRPWRFLGIVAKPQ